MTRQMLTLHRWLGLVAGLMILVAAGTAIGLNHQDLWKLSPSRSTGVTSPFQKYVLSTAVDPHEPSRVFVGTSDGLFRSLDSGKSWEEAVLPVPAEQVGSLQFDPRQPGVVYVALRSIGVFRSTDHGDIWEELTLPFYPPEGTQVTGLSIAGDGGLLLTTTDGLYRKMAHDEAWQHVAKPTAAISEDSKRWVQLVYDLHDGRFWGSYGVPLTDAVSVALILLVMSGYVLFFGRAIRRRMARRRSIAAVHDATRPLAAQKP